MSVAVNVSARQFRQRDLLAMIRQAIASSGLQAHHLVVELTESVVMSNADRSTAILDELHRCGLQIAVDDFGTGYSSMSYLKRFPVSKLKIDRSFINDLGSNAKNDSIVKAMIDIAHGLGMSVVAEGIETTAQLSCLYAFGCDQYQGYLFSRPLNAVDVAAVLHRKPQPMSQSIVEQSLLESASWASHTASAGGCSTIKR
jgi:EAL domain-containing protein (putative c-di-GMP-specific phosphodiesterase class I)